MTGVTEPIVKCQNQIHAGARGVETFKAEVERRAGIKFEPIRPYEFTGRGDRIGWVKGIDDNWHLTLFIENGRILDYPGVR